MTLPVIITTSQVVQVTPTLEGPSNRSLPQPSTVIIPPDVPQTAIPQNLEVQPFGAVLVRNPDFAVTLGHPATVRSGEEYDLFITVSNTGNTLANMVTVGLGPRALSGAAATVTI